MEASISATDSPINIFNSAAGGEKVPSGGGSTLPFATVLSAQQPQHVSTPSLQIPRAPVGLEVVGQPQRLVGGQTWSNLGRPVASSGAVPAQGEGLSLDLQTVDPAPANVVATSAEGLTDALTINLDAVNPETINPETIELATADVDRVVDAEPLHIPLEPAPLHQGYSPSTLSETEQVNAAPERRLSELSGGGGQPLSEAIESAETTIKEGQGQSVVLQGSNTQELSNPTVKSNPQSDTVNVNAADTMAVDSAESQQRVKPQSGDTDLARPQPALNAQTGTAREAAVNSDTITTSLSHAGDRAQDSALTSPEQMTVVEQNKLGRDVVVDKPLEKPDGDVRLSRPVESASDAKPRDFSIQPNTLRTTTSDAEHQARPQQAVVKGTEGIEGAAARVEKNDSSIKPTVDQTKPDSIATVNAAEAELVAQEQAARRQVLINTDSANAAGMEPLNNQIRTMVPQQNKRGSAGERVEIANAPDGSDGYHWLQDGDLPESTTGLHNTSLERLNDAGASASAPLANTSTTANVNAKPDSASIDSFAATRRSVEVTQTATPEETANTDVTSLEIDTPVGESQWSQAFAYRVQFMAQQGIQRAQVQLNPAELGPMEITVDMVDDVAQVKISAEHTATREAVEQAVPRLREMMAQSGFAETSVALGSDHEQTADFSREQQQYSTPMNTGDQSEHRGGNDDESQSQGSQASNPLREGETPQLSVDGRLSFYV